MTLYAIQNEAKRYLLILTGEAYCFTPTIPFRQLNDTLKIANQVAVKATKKMPELKGTLTIVPIELESGEEIEVEYPPEKEE